MPPLHSEFENVTAGGLLSMDLNRLPPIHPDGGVVDGEETDIDATTRTMGCSSLPLQPTYSAAPRHRERSISIRKARKRGFFTSNNNCSTAMVAAITVTAALLCGTALLASASTATAGGGANGMEVGVPDGLLFASETIIGDAASTNSNIRGLNVGSDSSSTTSTHHHQQQQPQNNNNEHGRVHPIHRIYRDNAHIRRRVEEELENSLPYFQTGIRGDPSHRVNYVNHPFDKLRKEREEKEMLENNGEGLNKEEDEARKRRHNRNLQDNPEGNTIDNNGASQTPNTDGTTTVDIDDPFQPIRIHFDTTALDAEYSSDNALRIEFVKNTILPRMANYWTSALSVVPVEGNLLVSTSELQGRLYCGDSEFSKVPATHISSGVPDADLVLYVSGAPSQRFCGPSTLAVAVACNFDQFDRPTAGAINFCLDQIDLDDEGKASESVTDDNVDVAVHEAAHVLGMSSNSYRFFWDPISGLERTGRPFSAKSVICVDGVERSLILPSDNTMKFFIATSGQRYASIVTPKVATISRNQFDCQELNGAQLENQPTGENSCTGDHWDERMYYPEALSGVISPTTNVVSPLTLALLEDSGWYRANYTKSHVSPWGKRERVV